MLKSFFDGYSSSFVHLEIHRPVSPSFYPQKYAAYEHGQVVSGFVEHAEQSVVLEFAQAESPKSGANEDGDFGCEEGG